MTKRYNVLVVDDDKEILSLLLQYLERQGFETRGAADLQSMHKELARARPDLVVLDIMLPDGSGLDACRDLRNQGSTLPIILLTAMSEEVDRIIGLEMGADDYLPKPFNPRELVARARAVLRRYDSKPDEPGSVYRFDGFTVDAASRTATNSKGEDIGLTAAEFDLLMVLLGSPGRVISRDHILDHTKGGSSDPFDRSVDVRMSRVRRKFRQEGGSDDMIKTVRNGGYQFTAKVVVSK